MSTQRTIITLAAGVIVGAAAGLLLAPEKGEVLRNKIKDQSCDATDKFNEKFNETKENIKQRVNRSADDLSSAASSTASKVKKATS